MQCIEKVMEVKITDEQKRLHNMLLTEINDQVVTSSAEYSAFKLHITKHLGGAGVLGRCNGLLDIFKQLSRRNKLGVLKYEILKEAFRDSNNVDVVSLIEEREVVIRTASGDVRTDAAPKRVAERDENAIQAKAIKTVNQDPSDGKWKTIDGLEYYETLNKTGFILVLHFYEDRRGLEGDLETLTDFFETRLGFDMLVLPYKKTIIGQIGQQIPDLTTEQLTASLEIVRAYLQKKRKEYYCFLCVVLSHGDEGTVKTADSHYKVHDIRKMFSNTKFEEFKGKPKIFIIQACQGDQTQASVEVDDQSDNEDQQRVVTPIDLADQPVFLPKDADTLIIFATTPGHRVEGDGIEGGTFLIRHFVNVVEDYHQQYHLEDTLITVRDIVSKEETIDNSMMPYTWSTLTKRLKFEPGTPRLQGNSTERFVRIDSNGEVHIDALQNPEVIYIRSPTVYRK